MENWSTTKIFQNNLSVCSKIIVQLQLIGFLDPPWLPLVGGMWARGDIALGSLLGNSKRCFFLLKKLGFLGLPWFVFLCCGLDLLMPDLCLLAGCEWMDIAQGDHTIVPYLAPLGPHISTYQRHISGGSPRAADHRHLLINISIYLWITSPTLQCYPESIYMHINISPKFHDWSVARNDGKPPELIAGNFSFLWNQFLPTGPTVQTHPTFLNNFLFSFYRAPTNKNNNFSRRPLSNSKPISELNKKIYIFCCRQHFLFYSPSSNIFCSKFACLAFGWQRASKQAFRSFFLQNLF